MYEKVAIVRRNLFPTERLGLYVLSIARLFAEQGAYVTILTTGEHPDADDLLRIKFLRLIPSVSDSYSSIKRFEKAYLKWLEEEPQDLVFGFDIGKEMTDFRLSRGLLIDEDNHFSKQKPWLKRMLAKLNIGKKRLQGLQKKSLEESTVRHIFVNSNMVKKSLLQNFKVNEKKVFVNYTGIDLKSTQLGFDNWYDSRYDIIKSLHLKHGAYHLLFVGDGKGYGENGLLELLAGLSEFVHENWQLIVVGPKNDLPLYSKYVWRNGLSKKVAFYSLGKGLDRFYQMADCVVIPSIYHPFNVVTIEALSYGNYIVTTKNNGAHEILPKEHSCIIENLHDKHSVAAALRRAFRNPKSEESALSARKSSERFDQKTLLGELIEKALEMTPVSKKGRGSSKFFNV